MQLLNRFQTTLVSSLFLLLAACTSENYEQQDKIIGRWTLDDALRNGKPTTSLEDIFFEFYKDGSIKTNFNLTGTTETGRYTFLNEKVLKQDTELSLEYNIENLNDSILVLSTQLQGVAFKLLLTKHIQEQ